MERASFQQVKEALLEDPEGAMDLFSNKGNKNPGLHRQLGGGNLAIALPQGYTINRGTLDMATATARVYLAGPGGKEEVLVIRQLIRKAEQVQLAWIDFPQGILGTPRLFPSWNWIKRPLERAGVAPPDEWRTPGGTNGFTQTLPEDSPLNVFFRKIGNKLLIGSFLGEKSPAALESACTVDAIGAELSATNTWWRQYWAASPALRLPDPVLQEIADFGLYKQACVTPPHAAASGLQGPFLEHYQMPPWGGDFHFNINVQMIYASALASNHPEHLEPLWEMMNSWLPKLLERGEKYYGRKNAIFLPTAMDDRGGMRGGFSPGMIDQANIAWMADIAWRHYRYTGDKEILEQTAWPFLIGAFEAYDVTLEESIGEDGRRSFNLPVSVSPEYGGMALHRAWGRNASFQLAAFHTVLRILPTAAKILNKPINPRWQEVSAHLPPYSIIDDVWMPEHQTAGARIALWDGQDLDGSHRHHSHLAGIYPFRTIDPDDPSQREILKRTLENWVFKGAGNWMGWSLPWASMIWSRVGNADAAVKWMHYWADNYVNEGGASLAFLDIPTVAVGADIRFPANGDLYPWEVKPAVSREKMQMDACMGALSAVLELLVQNTPDGTVKVIPNIPKGWKTLSFSNILTEGAFLVSASVKEGRSSNIKIKSTRGGLLKLKHGLGTSFKLNGKTISDAPEVLEYETEKNEEVILTAE